MKNITKGLLSVVLMLVLILSLTLPAAATEGDLNLPTASVTNLLKDALTVEQANVISKAPPLSFALQFSAVEPTDEQLAAYGNWYADFVLTVNKNTTFNANGGADGFLAGQYDAFGEGWVSVPLSAETVPANESFLIMKYASELLNEPGLRYKYGEVYEVVQEFNCGVKFESAFLEANPDFEVTLSLCVISPDESTSYPVGEVYKFTAKELFAASVTTSDTVSYYIELADALNAAVDGDTVTLLRNIELTEMVTVASGKSVTLELNGKTLSGVSSEAAASAVIENRGSLTIQDSVGDGKITSKALNPDKDWGVEGESAYPTYANNTINNYGALTLLSGTIENATDYSGATYAIDNYSGGSISIQGGKVFHNKGVAIRQFANSTTSVNSVAISGGTVEGKSRAVWLQLPGSDAAVAPKASLNINGGTLITNDTEYNHAVYVYSFGDSAANTTLRVTAGTIYGDIALYCNGLQLDNLAVTGGTFNGNYGIYGYTALPGAFITGGSFKYIYDTTLVAADYVCDVKVGNYYVVHKHNSDTPVAEVPATCTTVGTEAGTKCSVCGENKIGFAEIPARNHNWSDGYAFRAGGTTHWHACINEGCDAIKDEEPCVWGKNVGNPGDILEENDCANQYIKTCNICTKGMPIDIMETFWVAKENPVHKYDDGKVTTAPTCTTTGVKTYTCQNAGCGYTKTETVPMIPHTEVEIPAVDATCTEEGLSTGAKCSVCGTVTAPPAASAPNGHTEVEIPAKAATCTEKGLTAGKKCSVCGTVTVAQTEVAAKGHTEVELPAIAATCTEKGLTAGKKCSVCGIVTVAQTEVAAKGHTEAAIPAVAATCTKEGLTEGKKCSVCDTVLVEQTVVAKTAHAEEVIPAVAATCTEAGLTEGEKCTVCAAVTVEQTAVAALGHKLTKVEAKEATYTANGNIEYYTCSGCTKLFADAEGKTEITDVIIPQLIKIEGTTAKVETGAVDNAITDAVEKAESTGAKAEVVIEVEKAAEPDDSTESEKPVEVEKVVEVQLPVQSIDKVVEAKAELTVVMPNATVTVDTQALKAVSEQAAGEAVTLKVEEVKHEELTVVQQKAVEKYDVAITITAELVCQATGEKIWTEDNNKAVESGSITVKLPFTPAENTNGSDYQVLYIADNGAVVEIDTEYVDGYLVFSLEHFSDYVVVNTAAKAYPDSPATGDNANIALVAIVAILSVAGVAVCVLLMRKNRYTPKH